MSTPDFSFPVNLDDMSSDPHELNAWAEALFAYAGPLCPRVRDLLYRYACWKAEAMVLRLTGEIARARVHEQECARMYTMLPKKYRW